jgi:hypothetical protein
VAILILPKLRGKKPHKIGRFWQRRHLYSNKFELYPVERESSADKKHRMA